MTRFNRKARLTRFSRKLTYSCTYSDVRLKHRAGIICQLTSLVRFFGPLHHQPSLDHSLFRGSSLILRNMLHRICKYRRSRYCISDNASCQRRRSRHSCYDNRSSRRSCKQSSRTGWRNTRHGRYRSALTLFRSRMLRSKRMTSKAVNRQRRLVQPTD